jgi:TonB-linked SusC/RagA family outer membrane protein
MKSGTLRLAILALVLLLIPLTLGAQAGRVGGQVTDRSNGAPVEGARLQLIGTSSFETSNREGRFLFRSVAPGTYQVRAIYIGYQSLTQSVTVGATETASVDFALTAVPITLDEIVVTVTGEQRKLEVPNVVATIDAARVAELEPVTDLSSLITGRAAGVQVLKSGGATGAGSRLRIRGPNSASLSNEPLYYVDGIRIESNPTSTSIDFSGGVEGGTPSAINDINPDDIESIEIIKGPAAATLYGIQASNGVVRITTKRGNSGRPRWTFFTELGSVSDHNTYPINFFGRDNTATGVDYDGFCIAVYDAQGLCTQTSIDRYTPLEDPATRPLKAGLRQQYGGSVSGGSDFGTYFISASYENEDGVFRLPRFEEDSIRASEGDVPANQIRPNALEKLSLRANLGANLARNADISTSIGYITSDARFVENDNSFLSITGSGEASFNPPDANRGWFLIPAEIFAQENLREIERFTGGVTANWLPLPWLATRATLGYDVLNRTDVQFFPTGKVADIDANRAGLRTVNSFQTSQASIDLGVTGRFQLSPNIHSKTSVGAQYFRNLDHGVLATGRGLAAGSETITGAATTESFEQTLESRSAGALLEQEFSLHDRLFLSGAIRFEDNSADGENLGTVTLPKAGVSWIVSDEPFFNAGFINTLRLRGSLGYSGQQPGPVDAFRFFSPISGRREDVGETGVSLGSVGNPDLKPESTREIELGFDMSLFSNRVSVEFTFYNKRTKDALIARDLAPSLGTVTTQFFNLGEVRNRGAELVLDARIIDRPSLVWDVTLSGSLFRNRLIELGQGVAPIVFGFGQQRHVEGYPLGGYWSRRILDFDDANLDGLIDSTEYTLSDTAEFIGSGVPTREASLNSAITLFNGRIRLGGQFDYRGGHIIDNAIESFRCSPILICRGLVDRNAPLKEQAAAQAVLNDAVEFGYYEPAWFIKLRELSLTYFLPEDLASRFRASNMSITVAARNLWTITDYSGVDPEVNAFGQSNFSSSDFESQPQVRYYTVRVNLGF